MKVAYGHWPLENQVSKVSGSFSSLEDLHFGQAEILPSVSTITPPQSTQYLTGIGIPHQIWRLMGQSRMFSIQWRKIFSNFSVTMVTSFLSSACKAISRREGRPSGNFSVILMYHCGTICGSIKLPHL